LRWWVGTGPTWAASLAGLRAEKEKRHGLKAELGQKQRRKGGGEKRKMLLQIQKNSNKGIQTQV
jgi:hypothetical protein